jgi:hypothetical protein
MTGRVRAGAGTSRRLRYFVLALVVFGLTTAAHGAAAVTQAQVATANSAIQAAFASASSAEKAGGNVSSLDARLNSAILLVEAAEGENATNPAQAGADLQNATALAQSVVSESASVSQKGSAARQDTEVASLGASAAIVLVAALTYVFGGRIYRKAWLRLYKDYVVRPADG